MVIGRCTSGVQKLAFAKIVNNQGLTPLPQKTQKQAFALRRLTSHKKVTLFVIMIESSRPAVGFLEIRSTVAREKCQESDLKSVRIMAVIIRIPAGTENHGLRKRF